MIKKSIKITRIEQSLKLKKDGFSAVELVIVLVIIGILSAISLPYIYNYKKVYKSEDQSLKIMDLMNEAGQMALSRRRTFRFEIDLTANQVLIIDEGNAGPADDLQIKNIPLESTAELRLDQSPNSVNRPNPPNYNSAVFATDTVGHLLMNNTRITGHNVWAARFRSDGSVVNNAGTPLSTTLYVWPPASPGNAAARNLKEVRAITMFGGSGAVRYWKYDGSTFLPY